MTVTLATIHTAAADLISKVGWTQKTERDDDGRVCLTGALRFCQPQPGDDYLARGVYRSLGHAEEWNDDEDRTAADVVAWLRGHPVTGGLLAQTYGPQWEAVVALVRRAAVLTADEANALAAALNAADDAWNAAQVAAWDAARSAAWDTAWDAVPAAVPAAARVAVRDAVRALVVRDLTLATPDGTEHYRTLTRAWAGTVGPVHPDDDKD